MALLALACALSTLSIIPTTLAHMQMINPSPLRDPHSDRSNEPKDWNILTPLRSDGSDFACKGYQWNTPWTPTATYEAGKQYSMELKGGATHGGGSCQLSLSFDRGVTFRVIKSIEGGCPYQKRYKFTVPAELGKGMGSMRTTGLFAWTWFNRIGNREMYMNCAVVDIVPPGTGGKGRHSQKFDRRDSARDNAVAQAALSSYPPLFVANLAGINNCVTKEIETVIFDTPGADVAFAEREIASANPSFQKGQCTGQGHKSARSSSSSSSLSPSWQGASSSGDNGQWHGAPSSGDDGQWHGGKGGRHQQSTSQGGSSGSKPAQHASPAMGNQAELQGPADIITGKKPSPNVAKELNAYLDTIYGGAARRVQREANIPQPAKEEKGASIPVSAGQVGVSSSKNGVSTQRDPVPRVGSAHPKKHADHTTLSANSREFASIAGLHEPLLYHPEDNPEIVSRFHDLDSLSRLHERAVCKKVWTDAKRCRAPYRWVQKGRCRWSCRRKGRKVKKPNPGWKKIEKKLSLLEKKLAALIRIIRKQRKAKKNHRPYKVTRGLIDDIKQVATTGIAAVDTELKARGTKDPNLDELLIYLEGLLDKVVECKRYVAANAPSPRAAEKVEDTLADIVIPDLKTIKRSIASYALREAKTNINDPAKYVKNSRATSPLDTSLARSEGSVHKRQLVVPDVADLLAPNLIEYGEELSETVSTAIDTWLNGLGPLISSGKKLLQGDLPSAFNPATANFTGYDADTVSTAIDAWLKELGGVVGEVVKQSLEDPHPPPEGRPAYNLTTSAPYPNATLSAEEKAKLEWRNSLIAAEQHHDDEDPDAADAFSYFMGPGPVIPPDVHIDWPGPNHPGEGNLEKMPALVNDLGPGSEEEVRKWFEDLKEEEKEDKDGNEEKMW